MALDFVFVIDTKENHYLTGRAWTNYRDRFRLLTTYLTCFRRTTNEICSLCSPDCILASRTLLQFVAHAFPKLIETHAFGSAGYMDDWALQDSHSLAHFYCLFVMESFNLTLKDGFLIPGVLVPQRYRVQKRRHSTGSSTNGICLCHYNCIR